MQVYQIDPAFAVDDYSNPSPAVPTVKIGESYVNTAYAKHWDTLRKGRPAGHSHQVGNCGGYAGLCGTCYDLQLAWHRRVAREIAAAFPPLPTETDYLAYWVRVRGRMLDTWAQVASEVLSSKPA